MEYIFKIEKENKIKDNEEEIIKEENKEEKKEEKEIEITNNVQTSQEIQNNNYEILNDSEIIKDSNFIDIYKINEKIKEYDKLYPRRTKNKEITINLAKYMQISKAIIIIIINYKRFN